MEDRVSSAAHDRFDRVVRPHLAEVLRSALILTGKAHEAEDLAQETLLKAFRFIGRFEEGTDVRAWLMSILRNTRIDRLRLEAKRRHDVALEAMASEPEGPADAPVAEPAWHDPRAMLEAFSDAQVTEALQQLPEDIRWTLLLVDVQQLDLKEAAEVLDVPVGTVKSRTHRGRGMLRAALLPVAREMGLLKRGMEERQA